MKTIKTVVALIVIMCASTSFAGRWINVGHVSATNDCFWVYVESNPNVTPPYEVIGFTHYDCNRPPGGRNICENGLTVEENIRKHIRGADLRSSKVAKDDKFKTFTAKDCKASFEVKPAQVVDFDNPSKRATLHFNRNGMNVTVDFPNGNCADLLAEYNADGNVLGPDGTTIIPSPGWTLTTCTSITGGVSLTFVRRDTQKK